MMIMDQYPHVAQGAFKPQYADIKWPGSNEHFEKWCIGETGYPLIDAAMRHFNKTGWMHNRLRMIVAMFLCKDLLVDWRKGEAYFARYLLDFDLSANNGGWQWCASTGCDAQPYFRVFNPTLQSERFDTNGEFIREHCPELQGFSNKSIHAPWLASKTEQDQAKCIIGKNYPRPIVDHATQREKVLRLFKKTI
jgi:deoxyribodipyrimidine photo-lyase